MEESSHESAFPGLLIERRTQLRQLLEQLPTKERQVFVLKALMGKNDREIAAALGIRVASVEALVSLAGRELRKMLSDSSPGSVPQQNSESPEQKMPRTILRQQATATQQRRRRERVYRPPGWKLYDIARFFFSPKILTLILEPTIRDLQGEHIGALVEYEKTKSKIFLWKSWWVLVRGYWSFWSAVFARLPIALIKWVVKIWKAV